MKKRITRKAFVVLLVGVTLFLGASTAQAGWLFVLSSAVLGLAIGSIFIPQSLDGLELDRKLPRRVRVGDDVAVTLAVANQGRTSVPLARIEDSFEALAPTAAVCEKLMPGASSRFEAVRTAMHRGVYQGGRITVQSGTPFGLARVRRQVEVRSDFVVVPRWVDLRSFPILEPSSFPFETLHARARTGAGEEYLGVREYRPGDPRRAVHWRSTARAGRLVVKEYQEEATSRVTLLVHGREHATRPDSSFEALVSAAASIARYALVTGHPIELARANGPSGVERAVDLDAMGALDWLAAEEPSDAPLAPVIDSLIRTVSRRGTVVILSTSDLVAEVAEAVATVQRSGSRAIVVMALASSWMEGRSAELDRKAIESLSTRATVRVIERGEELARCLQA